MKLVSPPEDWKNAIDLTKATPKEVAFFLAKQNGLVCNERDGKIYIGAKDRQAPPMELEAQEFPLVKAPYYSQLDSSLRAQRGRSCFSSAVAMMVKVIKPGILPNHKNADDKHLIHVLRHGDTTDPGSQMRALKEYGIHARRRVSLDWSDVDRELERGHPVPIGILIRGHVSNPTGGGHWVCVVGKVSQDSYIVHDPYGELDLVQGRYLHNNGESRVYSRRNLGKRWMIEGPGSGWGVIVDKIEKGGGEKMIKTNEQALEGMKILRDGLDSAIEAADDGKIDLIELFALANTILPRAITLVKIGT